MPEIEPIELSEFVKKIISDIENGTGRDLLDPIEIEISITRTQTLEGGLKLYVASGGGETEKESIAKVRFKVPPKREVIANWTIYDRYHKIPPR